MLKETYWSWYVYWISGLNQIWIFKMLIPSDLLKNIKSNLNNFKHFCFFYIQNLSGFFIFSTVKPLLKVRRVESTHSCSTPQLSLNAWFKSVVIISGWLCLYICFPLIVFYYCKSGGWFAFYKLFPLCMGLS